MKLALIDIDGVLANDTHRVQNALNKHWDAYFAPQAVAADALWKEGKALVDGLVEDGWTIAYLTGRRYILRNTTERWLDSHEFPFGRLIMRETQWYQEKEKIRLADFKVEVIRGLLTRSDIDALCLFDDDPEVVEPVQDAIGSQNAVLCTWNIKPKALIQKASA